MDTLTCCLFIYLFYFILFYFIFFFWGGGGGGERNCRAVKLATSPSHSILTPGKPELLIPQQTTSGRADSKVPMIKSVTWLGLVLNTRGRYHGGRRPSSDDSLHSPTVIPPSALNKPSIMKRYRCLQTCSQISPRRSPTMVTLQNTRFV